MPHTGVQNVLGSLEVLVKPGAKRSALAGQGQSGRFLLPVISWQRGDGMVSLTWQLPWGSPKCPVPSSAGYGV